jgi:DNA repair protein RadA/Sms
VALSGEVRPVAHGGLRLKEAAKLGFERAWVPSAVTGEGISLNNFRSLGAMVDFMLGRG